MNRREFMIGSGITVMATAVPAIAKETVYKYPIIGQPIMACSYNTEDSYHEMLSYVKKCYSKRLYGVEEATRTIYLNKVRPTHNTGIQEYIIPVPLVIQYMAYSIIDVETFSVVKHRNGKYGYLQVPNGANKTLVEKNRRKYEQST